MTSVSPFQRTSRGLLIMLASLVPLAVWLAEGVVLGLADTLRLASLPAIDWLQEYWDWLLVLAIVLAIVASVVCLQGSEFVLRRNRLLIPLVLDAIAGLFPAAAFFGADPGLNANPAILAFGLHLLATAFFYMYLMDLARSLDVTLPASKARRLLGFVIVGGVITVISAFHGLGGFEQILVTLGAYVVLPFYALYIILLRRALRRQATTAQIP
jgi:hypothetical protein